jgi:acyloxyacyl hydrolase
MGGEPWEILEPIDGFHINQYAHALLSDILWEHLETNLPDWLGAVNTNNDLITKLFGDQGGY